MLSEMQGGKKAGGTTYFEVNKLDYYVPRSNEDQISSNEQIESFNELSENLRSLPYSFDTATNSQKRDICRLDFVKI
jgi:hypothetical protein